MSISCSYWNKRSERIYAVSIIVFHRNDQVIVYLRRIDVDVEKYWHEKSNNTL